MVFISSQYPEANENNTISVDFGTSNTSISWYSNGRVEYIPGLGETTLMKSALFYDNGKVKAGSAAFTKKDTFKAVQSFKRIMGIPYSEIDKFEGCCFGAELRMAEDKSIGVYMKKDKEYEIITIKTIVTDFLKDVKRVAKINQPNVTYVIITCPTTFTSNQKRLLRDCTKDAGFVIIALLTEPTAAGIHYRINDSIKENSIFLVYDFGGGTLDLSLVHFKNNMFEVIASGGESRLGGDDVDLLIYNYCEEQLRSVHGRDILPLDEYPNGKNKRETAKLKLLKRIEIAKISLQNPKVFSSEIDFTTDRGRIDGEEFNISLSREILNEQIISILQQSEECIDDLGEQIKNNCMGRRFGFYRINDDDDAHETMCNIVQSVLLVGGSSKLLVIEERLNEYFGKQICHKIGDIQHVVSHGALESVAKLQNPTERIREVLYTSYTVYSQDNRAGAIPRGTTIPFDVSFGLGCVDRNKNVIVEVYEDCSGVYDDKYRGTLIKKIEIDCDRFDSVNSRRFSVIRVNVAMDGLLTICLRDESTGSEERLWSDELYCVCNKQKIDLDYINLRFGIQCDYV